MHINQILYSSMPDKHLSQVLASAREMESDEIPRLRL